MNAIEIAHVLAGFAVPYIVSWIKYEGLHPRVTALIVILMSACFGVGICTYTHQLSAGDLVASVMSIIAVSQIFYTSLGKQLGLPEIEASTSPFMKKVA